MFKILEGTAAMEAKLVRTFARFLTVRAVAEETGDHTYVAEVEAELETINRGLKLQKLWEQCNGKDNRAAFYFFEEAVKELAYELPGVTFGYIGNLSHRYDDRSFRVFLPHPGRMGTYADCVGITDNYDRLYDHVGRWVEIEARAKELYFNGSRRA